MRRRTPWTHQLTRGRLARKHFSPSALPAAKTHFYIAAASVSARGDAQCVWSHESSISLSYERKRGSVCASCIVPGCCAQVALCSGSTPVFKLFCVALCKSFSRKTLGACVNAQDAHELWRCSAHYTSALQGCDFPVGAARTYYGFFA